MNDVPLRAAHALKAVPRTSLIADYAVGLFR